MADTIPPVRPPAPPASPTSSGLPPISLSHINGDELRRAWALMLVCSLWPTIKHNEALPIAQWIFDNRKDADR